MMRTVPALLAGAIVAMTMTGPAGTTEPPAAPVSWSFVDEEMSAEESTLLREALAQLTPEERAFYHAWLTRSGLEVRALFFEQFANRPARVQADFARVLYRLTPQERHQTTFTMIVSIRPLIPVFVDLVARHSPDEMVANLRKAFELEDKLMLLGQGKTDLDGEKRLEAMRSLMEQLESMGDFASFKEPNVAVSSGTPIRLAEVPFQVEIYKSGSSATPLSPKERADEVKFFRRSLETYQRWHECGGVLIAREWVLTAAHCIRQPASGDFLATRRVKTGTDRLTQGGTGWKIAAAVIHSGYDPDRKVHDIALLKIEADSATRPSDAHRARFALLASPTTKIPPGMGMIVSGFGVSGISRSGEKYLDVTGQPKAASVQLLKGDLVNLDLAECNNHPEFRDSRFTVGRGQLCARGKEWGVDACQGDSGGPLSAVINGRRVVLGLVSYGIGCGMNKTPGVYVDVRAYREWIAAAKLKAIEGKVACWSKPGTPALPARLTRPVRNPCPAN